MVSERYLFVKKILPYLIILSIFFSSIYAQSLEIVYTEDNTVQDISGGEYSLVTYGNLYIKNPSEKDTIFEYYLPTKFNQVAHIGGGKTSSSGGGDVKIDTYGIRGYLIGPKSNVSIDYLINARFQYNPLPYLEENNLSVLENFTQDIIIIPNLLVNLQKANKRNYSEVDQRLISADIKNPTIFDLQILNFSFYKTNSSSPMFEGKRVQSHSFNLSANTTVVKDFLDYQSSSNSVYWVSNDFRMFTTNVKNVKYNFIPFTQGGTGERSSSGGSSSGGGLIIGSNFTENKSDDNKNKINKLFIEKSVSKSDLKSGEEFVVTVDIVNNNDYSLSDLVYFDEFPDNFEIVSASINGKYITGNKVRFDILKLGAFDSLQIQYRVKNTKNLEGLYYLKPARVFYEGENFYSKGVALLIDFNGEKRIFLEKEITNEGDNFQRITIRVKNLGQIDVSDILVSDNIPDEAIVKQISREFYDGQRGVWSIKKLEAGSEWEVSYLIEKNKDVENLPNIYGINKDEVYGILISDKEIIVTLSDDPLQIEKVGFGVAIGIIIFYLLF